MHLLLEKKMSFHCDCRIFLNPFLSNITTVHCRSLRYVAGDWQKSLWELCFLSGAQCNKGLNTDDYTKVHLKINSSNVSVSLNYLKEIGHRLVVLWYLFRFQMDKSNNIVTFFFDSCKAKFNPNVKISWNQIILKLMGFEILLASDPITVQNKKKQAGKKLLVALNSNILSLKYSGPWVNLKR